jgi:hypothetical protein
VKGKSSSRNKTLKWAMASALLLSMTFLAVIPAAAGEEVVVNVNVLEEVVEKGESFVVTIDIKDVTDFNSGQFDLSFDSSVVEVTDVTEGSIAGETIHELLWDFVDGDTVQVSVYMPSGVGVNGSGHLAEVSFRVKGEEGDKSVLDISNGRLGDKGVIEFRIKKEFKDELNDKEISEELKEIFEANGRPLENPVVQVIQKDEKWKIIDRRVYMITFKRIELKVLDTGEILKTKWVNAEISVGREEEEEEEEEVSKKVTPGYSNITSWNPIDAVVNNVAGESRTFNVSVNQIADVLWQISGTVVQRNESTREAVYTNMSAVTGTWNVSAIATNTTSGLSDIHTWIWCVTFTATVTPTLAPGETPKPTPTLAPGETPEPTPTPTLAPGVTPTPEPPGFEAILAIAVVLAIAYILLRRR